MRAAFALALLACWVGALPGAWGAEERDLDYPELSVAPRATDRLAMEAAREPSYRWTAFLPVQASGLATLAQGIAQYDAANPMGAYLGAGVGLATFLTGTLLSLAYQPYSDHWPAVKGLPAGSARERLVRERFADIVIEDAGRSMRWVRFGVPAVNFATAIGLFLGRRTDYSANPAAVTQTAVGMAAVLASLAPLVLHHPAVSVADQQQAFKSRIYAPLASGAALFSPGGRELAPGAYLSWRF